MLKSLLIENIAVIEQAEITFDRGFSVLTGETGAGKSIIIDAMGAILGNRVSRELIRTGASRACISALLEELPAPARACAEGMGVSCTDGQLLLRREIYSDGRNVCRINGSPATLPMLRELGRTLVVIHGQHDGQHLLNEQTHIEYLDAFGALDLDVEAYYREYENLLRLNRRLKALSMSAEEQSRRRTELPTQIARLLEADVKPGEQEDLNTLRMHFLASEKLFESLSAALVQLDGAEDVPGAATQLALAERILGTATKLGQEYEELGKRMTEVRVLTMELSSDLAGALSRLDFSRTQMDETESRLDLISRLCSRFGVSADELEEHRITLENELAALENLDDGLDTLKTNYAAKRSEVWNLAGRTA